MTDFQNPQQEPGMERRLLLVFAIIFLLMIVFQPLLTKYAGKNAPAPQQNTEQTAPQPAPIQSVQPAPKPVRPAAAPTGKATTVATSEQETVVENGLYRITFTNKGAQVKSWILKKYRDDKGRPLELAAFGPKVQGQQNGQNALVPAVEKYGYPMSLWTYDEGLRNTLNSALYVASATGRLNAPSSVTFEYSDGATTVRKRFQFDDSYLVHVETSVTNNGQAVTAYPAWPSGFGDQTVAASFAAGKIVSDLGDKVTRIDAKKVSGGGTVTGPFNWAGVADQYFSAVFLPDQPDSSAMVTLHNEAMIPKNLDKPDQKDMEKVSLLGAAVGNPAGVTSGHWFIGPKAVDVIDNIRSTPATGQGVGPSLGGLVDFGFFGVIGKPIFLWLKWTEQHWIANWGWAIVIITVIINAALLPLRISSMKSALKMQRVQPQITAIKKKYEKYKMNDPRKAPMNQEISAVFKEHKVNPAGGCLPMILQMPVLFALFTMLGSVIELRHASWLWIRDLSAPDPYHIMPIVIVVTTWWQQKMTPATGMDPAQQRMMNLMMPVMLGFFSWAYQAGLSLYWAVGTVIAIVTQQVMNRTSLGQEMREIAEKRARKKALKAT
jgi:YidC/Oxa1 family membrane protein insertase